MAERVSKNRVSGQCTIFTILLTLWNSEQKNGLLIKLFCFSSDCDETWWSCSYPCVLQLHQVSSKSDERPKSLLIARFFVQNFKVSVELWKSYIVLNDPVEWRIFLKTMVHATNIKHRHYYFSIFCSLRLSHENTYQISSISIYLPVYICLLLLRSLHIFWEYRMKLKF